MYSIIAYTVIDGHEYARESHDRRDPDKAKDLARELWMFNPELRVRIIEKATGKTWEMDSHGGFDVTNEGQQLQEVLF